MKKFIFTLLLSIITLGVNAQEKTDYEKDTRKLVEMVYKASYENKIQAVGKSVKQKYHKTFLGQGERQMHLLFNKYTAHYMRFMSHSDIKATISKLKSGNTSTLLDKSEEIQVLEKKFEKMLEGTAAKYNSAS
ncbi:Clp protease/crotonase-like domain-containing protein [Aureivirga marina]|uniref:hypothetical protein n=1 Tax=Aureivirga marina TaxID=1182451 RepID=UPI0018C9B8D5|nr:hypothetical protein [Aureivirga marina]